MRKSIVLLSGGLDSCVSLAIAKEETDVISCLNVYYGQKHEREIEAATNICKYYKLPMYSMPMGELGHILSNFHASALVDKDEDLPKGRRMSEMTAKVPRSYVPGRNTIMLALAQSLAEASGADEIYTGFNAVDFSGYPDCRPIFVSAWNHLANYATRRGYEGNPITLVAPIVNLAKASVVRVGLDLKAPLELTWSCYAGGESPCGECDSCIIRWNAFKENEIDDPSGQYVVTPHRSVL